VSGNGFEIPDTGGFAMPTTAKFVGALFFAALAWFTTDMIKPLLPEGTAVGLFSPISAGLGVLIGWFFTGKRLDAGLGRGLGIGLTSSLLLVFWVLLTFSGYEMLRLSTRMRYDGPVEALQDMFSIALENMLLAATPSVLVALVVGGFFGGWLTEQVAKRWS